MISIDRSWRLLPIVLFVALRVYAHANPSDPLWIGGIYDGSDLDAALETVRVAYVAPETDLIAAGRPIEILIRVVSAVPAPRVGFSPGRLHSPRGPPIL